MSLDISLKLSKCLRPFCLEVLIGKCVQSKGKYEKSGLKMRGKPAFPHLPADTVALPLDKVLDRNKL